MRASHVIPGAGRFSLSSVVPFAATALVAASIGVCPLGCTSKKEKARDQMLTQAATLREGLKGIPPQLDEVSRRMLTAAEGQNPNRPSDLREFSKSLETLRSQARMVASEANKAEIDASKYFTAWAQEAKNTDLANQPAARSGYKASREQVDSARRLLDQARDNFRELIGSLDRIETKLKADPSDNAIAAIQSDLYTAQAKTMDVKNYIARLTESIDAALAPK